jgi:RHS repeat-associated protein
MLDVSSFTAHWANDRRELPYDPWGNITASTGSLATTNPWHYAGSYTDTATGYLKLGTRYYHPTTARFTQPDPSGQEANTYNYATCNPVNFTDPSGHSACSLFATGLGTVIGFASLYIGPAGVPTFLIGITISGTVEAGGCEEPPNQDYGASEYGYGT